jgi:AbrB family looped-hinge helix DNA binding protein
VFQSDSCSDQRLPKFSTYFLFWEGERNAPAEGGVVRETWLFRLNPAVKLLRPVMDQVYNRLTIYYRQGDVSMYATTISSKYQVVIPREVRKRFGLKPGQKVVFIPYNGVLRVVVVPPIEKARGMLKGMNTDNIREEVDEER